MDVNNGCGCHMDYKLSLMPVKQPISASMWTARSAFELADGAAVAEAVNITSGDKDNFFMGTSPAVSELGLAEPNEDQLVQAVLKMCERCPRLKLAFMENSRSELKCTTVLSKAKAARKVRVVERVRAILDGNKELRTEETIVIGGRNATRFAESLGLTAVSATMASEVRSYLLESHIASTVKRIFIWPEIEPVEFKNIVLDQFVDGFKQAVLGAARWEHIVFTVMPMVFASAHRSLFDRFNEEFKKDPPKLNNVLWLDDTVDWFGFRFSRALGANELCVDVTAVTQDGFITRKGAAAAVQFLKQLCSWLIIEHAPGPSRDLFEYQSPLQNPAPGVNRFNSARGVPSRGGGGGGRFAQAHRGRGFQPYNTGGARGRRGSKLNML
ncbi:hypothetical protein AAVH_29882 [Aphelenchoides avenae]|nr:hypothetical protein AAVH_29882 [Aphelenchus avenae]